MWLSRFLVKIDTVTGDEASTAASELAVEFAGARRIFEDMLMKRLGELVQIWSQQKQHLPTQVNGYCGGIFASYFETVCISVTLSFTCPVSLVF